MAQPEMPQRPGAESEALEVSIDGDTTIVAIEAVVRCSECGHVLTARKSVELEMGPVCRREVVA